MTETAERRGPIPPAPHWERELFSASSMTALDHLREKVEQIRRTFERQKLLTNVRRLLPFSFDPAERQALLLAAAALAKDPSGVSDKFVATLSSAVEKRLRKCPAPMERRSINASTRAASDRVISFVVSDESVIDRHGTVVKIDGLDYGTYLRRNPVVAWMHNLYGGWATPDPEHVIGRTLRMRRRGASQLEADIEFLPQSINPTAERVYQMVKRHVLSATSIGFIPRKVITEMRNGKEIPVIAEAELLEISIVGIPSNPGVEVTGGRTFNLDAAAQRIARIACRY